MPDFFSVLAPPWFWLCLGFVLLALELASTSAFFLCVSSAAFLLAGLTFAVPGLPWLWTFSLFALLLISASWVWWRFLYRRSGDARGNLLNARDRRIIGTVAVLSEDSSGLSGR
ncbi:MAG: NfeD family protein, partial [Desulfovibrio sp.]|nr:NfeD family protein [Desulfovibrio sp.]